MNLVKAGKYRARPQSWCFLPSSTDPSVILVFAELSFMDDMNQPRTLTWRGSLKEGKAREITLKALFAMGFQSKSFAALAEPNALDREKEVQIEVEHRASQQGKTFANIKWINKLGGEKFKKLAGTELSASLAALNIDGDLMAAAQEAGVELKDAEPNFGDLPF